MQFDNIPIVLSGKFSLPELGPARLATGMMYISVPGQSTSFGAGFAFGSATIGNRFTHFTASLGWGYFRDENEWDFAEKPILVLASNIRVLNSFAVVAEYWLPPEVDDPTNLPIALVRATLEISVVSVGWYLGGTVGIGTLLFAFGIGPCVALGLYLVDKIFN